MVNFRSANKKTERPAKRYRKRERTKTGHTVDMKCWITNMGQPDEKRSKARRGRHRGEKGEERGSVNVMNIHLTFF